MAADIARPLPVSQLIADGVAALIGRGALRPGDRLPSIRQLARERDVSAATALQALSLIPACGAKPRFVRQKAAYQNGNTQ
jgi:DNA-binding transcriptional regulator YhcF (GntR family)